MVSDVISGLGDAARGFNRGLSTTSKVYGNYLDRKNDRAFSRGLGEVYGSDNKKPEDMSGSEYQLQQLKEYRDLAAQYKPNILPQINSQIANFERGQQQSELTSIRLQNARNELETKNAVENFVKSYDYDNGTAFDFTTELTRLTGKPDAALTYLGDRGEALNRIAAGEFVQANDDSLVSDIATRVQNGVSGEIIENGDGTRTLRTYRDNDPTTTVNEYRYSTVDELKRAVLPKITQDNPNLGNAVLDARAEAREAALNNRLELSSDERQALVTRIDQETRMQLENQGGDPRDPDPDLYRRVRDDVESRVIQDYLRTQQRFRQAQNSPAGLGSGGAPGLSSPEMLQRLDTMGRMLQGGGNQPQPNPQPSPQPSAPENTPNTRQGTAGQRRSVIRDQRAQ